MSTENNEGVPDTGPIVPDTKIDTAPVKPVPTVTPTVIPTSWVRVSHHTPDHIATRYFYCAYGSNLSFEQMVRRCPTSDIYGHGMLRNAKLIFAYHLGIIESEGASTPVAVFRMTVADVAAMDRCEGLGRAYERYLVTVELKGEAVRCFTYVKRDNALEEPSERYYQTCLKGYTDWDFDTRRLRHAREDAKKNGKRRTYSSGYGYWDGTATGNFDWDSYRRGSRNNTSSPQTGLPFVPTVKTHDELNGDMEPIDESRMPGAGTNPRISLVTGRELPSSRRERRIAEAEARRPGASIRMHDKRADIVDPARISTLNGENAETFVGRDGQSWRKGKNGVWYRAKG